MKKTIRTSLFLLLGLTVTLAHLSYTQTHIQTNSLYMDSSYTFQSILDSVSIDEIYQTERHITGEEEFEINGEIDSIKTRFTYSYQIYIAQDYFQNRLEEMGYTVELQPFFMSGSYSAESYTHQSEHEWLAANNQIYKTDDGDIVLRRSDSGNSGESDAVKNLYVTVNNIIATKTGTTYPDQYFIICAHYDAISDDARHYAPGADDNGSGTATVLEAARVLFDYDFQYTIKFILFCGEEQGIFGSTAYALLASENSDQILGVINLDMIGFDHDDTKTMEIHSGNMPESQTIGNLIYDNIAEWNLSLSPIIKTYDATNRSDHAPFWYEGYPAVLLIEDMSMGQFNFYYHSTSDIMEHLNPDYFLEIAKLSIGSLALLAGVDTSYTHVSRMETAPELFILYDPYPNPFNSEVHITYDLSESGEVLIEIYNLLGQRLKRVLYEDQTSGHHHIIWHGKNDRGDLVPSGVYFIRLQVMNQINTKKIALIQ